MIQAAFAPNRPAQSGLPKPKQATRVHRGRVGPRFSVLRPCGYLEKMTQPGVRKALEMRGGLCCDVIEGGTVRIGDPVEA